MSKVKFKSVQDIRQFSDDGQLLHVDLMGKIAMMLKHVRESRSLSMLTVSEATGIKISMIELIEKGHKKVRWCILARLMRYYGFWVELHFLSQPKEIKFDEVQMR